MVYSKKQYEGEIVIDHRASPGTLFVPEGILYEETTITCSHCHRTWILNRLRTRPREWCHRCDHYICDDAGCIAIKESSEPCQLSAKLEILRNKIENQ